MKTIPVDKVYKGGDLGQIFKKICIIGWGQKSSINLSDLADILTKSCQDSDTLPLKLAIKSLAFNASYSGRKNTYHNPVHTARVAMMAAYFAKISGMNDHDYLKIVSAAFGHDMSHPGQGNPKDKPFANEQVAASQTGNILYAAGVEPQDIQDIEALILATSPNGALEILKDKQANNIAIETGELQRFNNRPDLLKIALILTDADIFESAGVDYETFAAAGRALETESSKSGENLCYTSLAAQTYFFDNIVGEGGFSSPVARSLANDNYFTLRKKALESGCRPRG